MSHLALRPWESVLVRHQLTAKHGELASIESSLGASFKTSGAVSTFGNAMLANMHASGRWMAAGQFGTSSWTSLNSNVGTAEELFQANCQGRRTEVVWAGKEPGNGEVVLCWVVARKSQLSLRGQARDDAESWRLNLKCTSPELKKSLLACRSITAAFDLACKHLSLKTPAPRISQQDKKFICIGASGKPVTTGLKDFRILSASGLAAEENPASVKLADAIEAGNVKKIRQAIAAGASLEALPESSLTPLVSALLNSDSSQIWRECCQALIDAGCSVHGDGLSSPLHDACEHYIDEEMSIEMVDLLLENGADINGRDRNGFTVLDKAACYRRLQLVEFLLSHGADPNLPTRGDKSIVDEIRSRYEKDLEYSDNSEYHRVLELLTGTTIAQFVLPPAAQQEAERFLSIAKSQFLREIIPEAPKLQPIKTSRLAKFDNYSQWTDELKRLGFEEAAHCAVTLFGKTIYSCFVHPKLGFDAVLSDDGPLGDGTLRLEVAAYHSPQSITLVTNKPTTEDPNLSLSLFKRRSIVGASPTSLVKELKQLIKSQPIQSITTDSFLERFTQTLGAMLDDFRNAAHKLGSQQIVLPSGELPRFERLGLFIKVKPQAEVHECSSVAYVTGAKKNLERETAALKNKKVSLKPYQLRDIIHDTAVIAAVNHLQMAAAEDATDYYRSAIQAGIAMYGTTAAAKAAVADSWSVDTFAYVLTLALFTENWTAAKQVSAGIGADFAHPKHHRFSHNEPVAVAQWQVLLTNRFRDRDCPKSKQFRNEIMKGRCKHAKTLLAALDALDAKDGHEFSSAIAKSITVVDTDRRQSDRAFDVYRSVAWNESLLWMIARHEGLKVQLSPEQLDYLMV